MPKYKITIFRNYHVTHDVIVEADTIESAREQALDRSDNTDLSHKLQLGEVEVTNVKKVR